MFNRKIKSISFGLLGLAAIFLSPTFFRFITKKPSFVPIQVMVVRNLQDTNLTLSEHWIADSLEIGDEERSPSGMVVAKLKDIKKYEEGYNKVAVFDVDVLANYDQLTGRYQYKSDELLVGKTLELKLGKVLVFGQIISAPGDEKRTYVDLLVSGYVYDQTDLLANAVEVGDEMTSGKDRDVIGKILSREIFPASTEYRVNEGFLIRRSPSNFKDIFVTLTLKVQKVGGSYVFAALQPVKINNKLDLPFDKYNLYEFRVKDLSEIKISK